MRITSEAAYTVAVGAIVVAFRCDDSHRVAAFVPGVGVAQLATPRTSESFDSPRWRGSSGINHETAAAPMSNGRRQPVALGYASSPPPLPETNDPYALLGLFRQSNRQEIKRAYKAMASQYHPDVVVDRDSTAAEKKRANDNFARINAAYNTLRVDAANGAGVQAPNTPATSPNGGWWESSRANNPSSKTPKWEENRPNGAWWEETYAPHQSPRAHKWEENRSAGHWWEQPYVPSTSPKDRTKAHKSEESRSDDFNRYVSNYADTSAVDDRRAVSASDYDQSWGEYVSTFRSAFGEEYQKYYDGRKPKNGNKVAETHVSEEEQKLNDASSPPTPNKGSSVSSAKDESFETKSDSFGKFISDFFFAGEVGKANRGDSKANDKKGGAMGNTRDVVESGEWIDTKLTGKHFNDNEQKKRKAEASEMHSTSDDDLAAGLQKEVTSLRNSLAEANQRISTLMKERSKLERNLERRLSLVEEAGEQLQSASEERRASLEKEILTLRTSLEEAQNSLSALMSERDVLQETLKDASSMHTGQMSQLRVQMEAEWTQRMGQVQSAGENKRVELEREISALHASLDQANLQVDKLSSERANLEQTLENSRELHAKELSELNNEVEAKLSQRLEEANVASGNQAKLAEEAQKEFDQKRTELEKEISNLRASLANANHRVVGMSSERDDLTQSLENAYGIHAAQVSELKAEMETEQSAFQQERSKLVEEAQTSKREISNLRKTLAEVNHRVLKLSSERDDLAQSLENTYGIHAAQLSQLRAEMEAERKRWEDSGKATQSDFSHERAELKKEITTLRASLDEANRRVSTLTMELIEQEDSHEDSFGLNVMKMLTNFRNIHDSAAPLKASVHKVADSSPSPQDNEYQIQSKVDETLVGKYLEKKKELESANYRELQLQCKKCGLRARGPRTTLIHRLAKHSIRQ